MTDFHRLYCTIDENLLSVQLKKYSVETLLLNNIFFQIWYLIYNFHQVVASTGDLFPDDLEYIDDDDIVMAGDGKIYIIRDNSVVQTAEIYNPFDSVDDADSIKSYGEITNYETHAPTQLRRVIYG